ncbi:acyl-CoA dehydrogenase family protein [Sphingomonas sp. MMS24-JH45]
MEHGGPGWDDVRRYVFAEEAARAGAPGLSPMGLKMVAPVIMHYGTPEQKATLLPASCRARLLSTGYSEPGAGCRPCRAPAARRPRRRPVRPQWLEDLDHHAHFANHIYCLVRTNNEGRPQSGIAFLLLDRTLLRALAVPSDHDAGDQFNQVFGDRARARLGQLGKRRLDHRRAC